MNAWQAHRSLTPEQKQLIAAKTVDLNRRPDELIALLTPVASYDKVVDKMRKPLGCTGCLAFVACLPLFFMFAASDWRATLYGLGFVAVLLIAIVAFFGWRWTNKVDLSDNLRGTALPLLNIFREDFARDEPVHVRLDLRPPTDKTKKQSESAPYKHGAYYKIIDTMYADPWMDGEAVLQDGSAMKWSIVDTIRERKKTKKNPRGKIKTKTKYTKKTKIEVSVALRTKTYAITPAGDAEIKRGEKKNVVSVSRRIRTAALDPIHPTAFVELVADVFKRVRPAGKEA
ncbi:MAG TPA: hypothetical protein VN181_00640 [Thermoanaerobaculia bacterium]|nr:hypothetical protein [Thermoanaerobaculia bacterium]